jgi:hypothetical protein
MAANSTAKAVAPTARKRAARKPSSASQTAATVTGVSLDRKLSRKAQSNLTELARTGNTDASKLYWNNALRSAGVLGADAPNLRSV